MKSFTIRASMCILHASRSKNVRSRDLNVYSVQIPLTFKSEAADGSIGRGPGRHI
jgi:hypothetical protein